MRRARIVLALTAVACLLTMASQPAGAFPPTTDAASWTLEPSAASGRQSATPCFLGGSCIGFSVTVPGGTSVTGGWFGARVEQRPVPGTYRSPDGSWTWIITGDVNANANASQEAAADVAHRAAMKKLAGGAFSHCHGSQF